MTVLTADDRLAPASTAFEEDVRRLIPDLGEAAHDGRHPAQRCVERTGKIVEAYCVEFEKRAEAVLVRLEA